LFVKVLETQSVESATKTTTIKSCLNNGKKIKRVYNLILYIGLFLMAFGFILFIISEMEDRRIDRELFKQQQLTKSFMKAKADEIKNR